MALQGLGKFIRSSPKKRGVALGVGLIAVGLDFCWVYIQRGREFPRFILGLLSLGILIKLNQLDSKGLGISLHPKQTWKYWTKISVFGGITILTFTLTGFIILSRIGFQIPVFWTFQKPAYFWTSWFFPMGFFYPLLEELLYRGVLCNAFSSIFSQRLTVFFSGIIFAALHFVYGNPSPDNFIAGFFLSWAFLKSESLTLPLLLHSCGNLAVGLFHLDWTNLISSFE